MTRYHIFPSEWDERSGKLIIKPNSDRTPVLLSLHERIKWDLDRLTKIIQKLENDGLAYSIEDIINAFHKYAHEYSLFNFMETIIIKLKQNGKIRTSETYSATLNSFKKFLVTMNQDKDASQKIDIMLDRITSDVMEAYEAWQRQRGIAPNTISFYLRILRAVYNRAVEEEIIENRNPFRHVYTGVDKTVKRALPLSMIKKIKALDLSLYPLTFASTLVDVLIVVYTRH